LTVVVDFFIKKLFYTTVIVYTCTRVHARIPTSWFTQKLRPVHMTVHRVLVSDGQLIFFSLTKTVSFNFEK